MKTDDSQACERAGQTEIRQPRTPAAHRVWKVRIKPVSLDATLGRFYINTTYEKKKNETYKASPISQVGNKEWNESINITLENVNKK